MNDVCPLCRLAWDEHFESEDIEGFYQPYTCPEPYEPCFYCDGAYDYCSSHNPLPMEGARL